MEEVKKLRISCIYRITFPDGKYYVGHTKNLCERVQLYERNLDDSSDKSRVMCALRECGIRNVSWDVLCAVSVKCDEDLKLCLSILEIKYIRENGCIYPNGYNTSIGGELLGIPSDVIEMKFGVDATGYAPKPVLVYDAEGNFMSEHASIGRCAYALGVDVNDVKRHIGKVSLVRGTYMVREKKYREVPSKIVPFEPSVSVRHVTKTEYDVVREKIYRKVEITNAAIMYDKDGNYVGLFDNSNHSRHFLRLDFACPFGRETRGMYLFHYNGGEIKKSIGRITSKVVKTILYDDILAYGDRDDIGSLISFDIDIESEVEEECDDKKRARKNDVIKKERVSRPVSCYTLIGEYVNTFSSVVEAADELGMHASAIRSCIARTCRRAGEYVFRYADEDLDLPEFSSVTLKKYVKK